jgi:deoxyhypusine synthase
LGNAYIIHQSRNPKLANVMKPGIDYMHSLVAWYADECQSRSIGFFQVGGGLPGDFAVCVVPLLRELIGPKIPEWSYFCQVSDSTTSYGSYSGAPPGEKITWGKLGSETPMFMIESDATIVVPLIFGYVLRM